MSRSQPDGDRSTPDYDLDFGVDDPDDPEKITVHSPRGSDGFTTEWLTIEKRYAISWRECR